MSNPRLKIPPAPPTPPAVVKGAHESKQAVVKLFPADESKVKEARRAIFEGTEEVATVSEILRYALRSMGKVDAPAFLDMRDEMRAQDGRARRHAGPAADDQPPAMVAHAAEEDGEASRQGGYRPSNGMMYADNAISQLGKIDPRDSQREEGFAKVQKWIVEQLAESKKPKRRK